MKLLKKELEDQLAAIRQNIMYISDNPNLLVLTNKRYNELLDQKNDLLDLEVENKIANQ